MDDTIAIFDCNDEDLNDFLLNEANLYRQALLSVTYVESGCRFVTVDAYVDAIPFYIKNNYQFLNNDDDEDKRTRVMYFDLASLL